MSHQKHTKLQKPVGGLFGRNELGIMGAPCGDIKALSAKLIATLKDSWHIGYIDADHNAPEEEGWSALQFGAVTEFVDRISYKRLDALTATPDFRHIDLTLINANHHKAAAQIAFVHPKKDLAKKQDKLTNVVMVILEESVEAVPDFLVAHINNTDVPVFKASELEKISQFIEGWLRNRIPKLYGLVLAGGKSTRMNKDKSQLEYHHKPQQQYAIDLLSTVCENVFVSSRDESQSSEINIPSISDKFVGLGPYGGILSAFMQEPNVAWLVIAVDLPFLDADTIHNLVECRNSSKLATCFIDPQNEFPEPLISIWEPRAYPRMLDFLSKGYSCPRKVLINSDVEIIAERNVQALTNVNTPEEFDEALKIING
ncbi:MAG: NTP transferase domain-containing protein [Cyclobacteriaceae bacterium]|nr:NTP transferase domain-containing protein [Cyclobacteriaceae bacterium]